MLTSILSRLYIRFLETPAPRALLTDLAGHSRQAEYRLLKRIVRVGRFRRAQWILRNDIVIPYQTVSRRHAEVRFRDGAFYLRDLSVNGTFRHFIRLKKGRAGEIKLQDGDILRFDAYEFRFALSPEPAASVRPVVRDGVTWEGPALCFVHSAVPADARCPLCAKPFCCECLADWAGRKICQTCRAYVLSEASPQEVQQLLCFLTDEAVRR